MRSESRWEWPSFFHQLLEPPGLAARPPWEDSGRAELRWDDRRDYGLDEYRGRTDNPAPPRHLQPPQRNWPARLVLRRERSAPRQRDYHPPAESRFCEMPWYIPRLPILAAIEVSHIRPFRELPS